MQCVFLVLVKRSQLLSTDGYTSHVPAPGSLQAAEASTLLTCFVSRGNSQCLLEIWLTLEQPDTALLLPIQGLIDWPDTSDMGLFNNLELSSCSVITFFCRSTSC